MKALIGHTGFVGSNILQQADFDKCYNSTNIESIGGEEFDLVICAGASSVKWKVNKYPNQDFEQIQRLVDSLSTCAFKKLVLVSTIAVYDNPVDNAYGRHRLYLETLLMNTYPDTAIIRLPALFGKGLKKNAIYDLMNKDYRFIPDPKSSFQYYCLDNIWRDIEKQMQLGIKTLNINSEGIEFGRVLKAFGVDPSPFYGNYMVHQDMQSNHASHWGKEDKYLYTQEEVLETLERFINRE